MVGWQQATTIADATANLNPDMALEPGHAFHVPLSEARGADPLREMLTQFQRQRPGEFSRVVCCSHSGSGKTTELLNFAEQLKDRYETLYLVANAELDPQKFDSDDLLLTFARKIEERWRERGTPLDPATLDRVERWFAEEVVERTLGKDYLASVKAGAKLNGGIPFFASLFSEITAIFKQESKLRETIKNELRKYPGTLLSAVNQLLEDAAAKLPAGRRLLVMIDNLDRYNPAVVDQLLVSDRERFKALRASFVFTPPVDLLYRPVTERLPAFYDVAEFPTVKLRGKTAAWSDARGPGYDAFRAALAKRFDLPRVIPDENALRQLIAATGGSIRSLIHFARRATLVAAGVRIEAADVERVLRDERNQLRGFVAVNDYLPALAKVGAAKYVVEDQRCLDLLYHRLVFRYNGDTWYDVHPLIQELPEYQQALKTARPLVGGS